MGEPWQVLAECPHCRVEAAVLQVMDPTHPACHLGRPAEQRCRLCGWATVALDEPFAPRLPPSSGRCPACNKPLSEAARTGQGICPHCRYTPRLRETEGPVSMRAPGTARAALIRWAALEGEADVDRFCHAHMGEGADEVVGRLGRGERVGTTFDVIAWLFPDSGGGAVSTRADAPGSRPVPVGDRRPAPAEDDAADAPLPMDPHTAARVLVSVMAADGELRPGELRFIRRFLESEGLPPMDPADLRIWRPHELPVPAEAAVRSQLIEACVHLMHLDRQRDGSEWKVVRAFAAAWGIADDDLHAWDRAYDARYSTVMTRLWGALSRFVRVR